MQLPNEIRNNILLRKCFAIAKPKQLVFDGKHHFIKPRVRYNKEQISDPIKSVCHVFYGCNSNIILLLLHCLLPLPLQSLLSRTKISQICSFVETAASFAIVSKGLGLVSRVVAAKERCW